MSKLISWYEDFRTIVNIHSWRVLSHLGLFEGFFAKLVLTFVQEVFSFSALEFFWSGFDKFNCWRVRIWENSLWHPLQKAHAPHRPVTINTICIFNTFKKYLYWLFSILFEIALLVLINTFFQFQYFLVQYFSKLNL